MTIAMTTETIKWQPLFLECLPNLGPVPFLYLHYSYTSRQRFVADVCYFFFVRVEIVLVDIKLLTLVPLGISLPSNVKGKFKKMWVLLVLSYYAINSFFTRISHYII